MRTEVVNGVTTVALSRRNLRALLAKLDGAPPDSACTLVGPNMYPPTVVVAEEDDVHYLHESRETWIGRAGRLHPDTVAAMNRGPAFDGEAS